jgi:trehalose/maltose hydrolase-like predicted phosphorylase
MYHLLAIVPARDMSGQMYKGAIFWDTEIFMLPFFTHAFPSLTRSLLLYRYHTLDGARRKAHEYGYRGAFYAWESQDSGDDGSIWQEGGAQVVFECARFFLSYAYYNPDKRRYEILDVTGPDEYYERVHNNAFTNRLVTHTFEVCLQVAALLKSSAPEYLEELIETLGFEQDLARIRETAALMYQPDDVPPGAVIPQFDGYFTLEDVPLQTLLERKLHPHEYLGGGSGLATTTQIISRRTWCWQCSCSTSATRWRRKPPTGSSTSRTLSMAPA